MLASRDVYLTERGFDMDGMLDFYGAELRGVAEGRSGYSCIRTAGEMTWALRDIPGVEDLLAYEARVNQVMAANPEASAISLYLYDVERFDAELIVWVLRTHPKANAEGPRGPQHRRRAALRGRPGIAPAILALGNGSYGVLYAAAGISAMLGAAAILPVKGVR